MQNTESPDNTGDHSRNHGHLDATSSQEPKSDSNPYLGQRLPRQYSLYVFGIDKYGEKFIYPNGEYGPELGDSYGREEEEETYYGSSIKGITRRSGSPDDSKVPLQNEQDLTIISRRFRKQALSDVRGNKLVPGNDSDSDNDKSKKPFSLRNALRNRSNTQDSKGSK